MKVLQVINSLNTGGAEKLLLETIPLYNIENVKVDLLLLDGTEYPFLKELKKANCCSIYSLSKGSVYNPLFIFKIIPFLEKYNLVHVHLFPSLYFVALAKLLSFSKVKIVYTEHNTNNKRRNSLLFKYIERFIYRIYAKWITIAEEVDLNLKKHLGNTSSKFTMIKNGVNLKTINQAVPYLKTSFFDVNDIILIQVSSFTQQKDQGTLIKSLVALPSNFKLILIGEGETKESCEELVIKLNLIEKVKFLGIRTDVPQLLKTSDIVVLSSNYEGLSLSSMEGIASGNPFVASDVPGLTEVVQGAGLLFPNGDSKVLANLITELINNSDYYNEISEKCLERSKQYDISVMVEKHIALYKSLL